MGKMENVYNTPEKSSTWDGWAVCVKRRIILKGI
jgi:hypothetical protein